MRISVACVYMATMAHPGIALLICTTSTKLQAEEVLEPFPWDIRQFWNVVSNTEATVDILDACLKGTYTLGITQPRHPHLCILGVHCYHCASMPGSLGSA